MTTGRGPAAPGGAPRSPRNSGCDSRQRQRPGESGDEIIDIGAICRTDAIVNAFTARRAGEREPGQGHSGPAGEPEPGAASAAAACAGDVCAADVSGAGMRGSDARSGPGSGPDVRNEPASAGDVRTLFVDRDMSDGDPALCVLAALMADVDEGVGPRSCCHSWQNDIFLRQIRAACRTSRVAGTGGAGSARSPLGWFRAEVPTAVAVAIAAATLAVSGVAGAAMHGRLPWLATTSGQDAAAGQQQVRKAPADRTERPQVAAAGSSLMGIRPGTGAQARAADARAAGAGAQTAGGGARASGPGTSGPVSTYRTTVRGQVPGHGQQGRGPAASTRSSADGRPAGNRGRGRAGISGPASGGPAPGGPAPGGPAPGGPAPGGPAPGGPAPGGATSGGIASGGATSGGIASGGRHQGRSPAAPGVGTPAGQQPNPTAPAGRSANPAAAAAQPANRISGAAQQRSSDAAKRRAASQRPQRPRPAAPWRSLLAGRVRGGAESPREPVTPATLDPVASFAAAPGSRTAT